MLDIRLIRRDPGAVRSALSRRGADAAQAVDRVLELDEQWRALTTQLEQLRSEQNAASKAMPSGLLVKAPAAPSWPMRASKDAEEISTPQMIRVTVTFLVRATECHATVRSCVTWAAVPGLSVGE